MLYNTDLYLLATLSIAEEEKCNSCGCFVSEDFEALKLHVNIVDPPKILTLQNGTTIIPLMQCTNE